MKAFARLFENIFTSATSEKKVSHKDVYREWTRQREDAARFGQSHVQEIDAIFSRAGY